ncbi:hypothetical protein [Macrococcus equipercicus]|uniref:Uncharacterized protein n=1 Tax=Macrococcus equipercicus TaxID=69967 RepID=A0A9Q9BLB7_9STAP|nr:hypothetical protein [Macrococcus equipercicus]UTH13280.1 hypothetical protein KFV11_08395 [Macrococcus equipercicus]
MTKVSEQDLQQLINSDIAANKIATETGVSASAIQRIRLGERKLGNLTFDTCKKLQKYWEELNMKNIRWTGKTTDGRKHFSAEGKGYYNLFSNIEEKYGYGNIIDEQYENADRSNWTEDQYKEAIEESTSEAYYQTFEEEATVAFVEEGDVKETKTGYKEDIIEWTVEILNNMSTDYDLDFEDLILDVEQANDTDEVLTLLEENFNDSTYKFDAQ